MVMFPCLIFWPCIGSNRIVLVQYHRPFTILFAKRHSVVIPILFGVGILLSLLFPVQAKAISSKSLEFFKSFIVGKVQTAGTNYANKSSV